MRAMVLDAPRSPLRAATLPVPAPGPDEVLIRVGACAICRTDLHVVDGELPRPKLPLVPGHEIAGTVVATAKGGIVVCAGIHMSDIPSFPYALLWGERMVRSVANLTRRDGEEFLTLAPRVPVRTQTQTYRLEEANQALDDLRHGRVDGAAVLRIAAPT